MTDMNSQVSVQHHECVQHPHRTVEDREIVLSASHVSFSYEKKQILHDVTLEVPQGVCMCLMGINGCGKSTFLDCILGENKISQGDILIKGHSLRTLKPKELASLVSYVPQMHKRSFPYPVEHVVMMGRTVHMGSRFAPDSDDEEIVDEALHACGIAHLKGRPHTSLSGGEIQMVMLARALAQQTPIVLMDEPTAHLDFKNELLFLETVERLVAEQGVTVLMATHSPNQAFHLANGGVSTQVAVLNRGEIALCGSPREVLTEEMLRTIYDVDARLFECEGRTPQERMIRQIIPMHTLTKED